MLIGSRPVRPVNRQQRYEPRDDVVVLRVRDGVAFFAAVLELVAFFAAVLELVAFFAAVPEFAEFAAFAERTVVERAAAGVRERVARLVLARDVALTPAPEATAVASFSRSLITSRLVFCASRRSDVNAFVRSL